MKGKRKILINMHCSWGNIASLSVLSVGYYPSNHYNSLRKLYITNF